MSYTQRMACLYPARTTAVIALKDSRGQIADGRPLRRRFSFASIHRFHSSPTFQYQPSRPGKRPAPAASPASIGDDHYIPFDYLGNASASTRQQEDELPSPFTPPPPPPPRHQIIEPKDAKAIDLSNETTDEPSSDEPNGSTLGRLRDLHLATEEVPLSEPLETQANTSSNEYYVEGNGLQDMATTPRNSRKGDSWNRLYRRPPIDGNMFTGAKRGHSAPKGSPRLISAAASHLYEAEPNIKQPQQAIDHSKFREQNLGCRSLSGIPHWESNGEKSEHSEQWQLHKEALRKKFGDQPWNPRRKLSPDAMDGIRAMNAQYPTHFTTPVLANHFKVSPEAIRRILKSKWQPKPQEEERRRQRWDKRGERIWSSLVEQGIHAPKKWRDMGIGRGPRKRPNGDYHQRRNVQLEANTVDDQGKDPEGYAWLDRFAGRIM